MPSILKRFTGPDAVPYQFPPAQTLGGAPKPPPPAAEPDTFSNGGFDRIITKEVDTPPFERAAPPANPVEFAQVQSEALLEDARREATSLLAQAKLDAEAEIANLREQARQDGYRTGYAEGLKNAIFEGRQQRIEQAEELGKEVKVFLEKANYTHDELLDQTRSELKDLSLTIAEKVIRVSLKSSGDVVARMIQTATEKMKRKEWVHIYVADCDSKGIAKIAPQLTESLSYLSDHVKLVPMANDESGTCIIETPDEIIDASASTQLSSIRDLLSGG